MKEKKHKLSKSFLSAFIVLWSYFFTTLIASGVELIPRRQIFGLKGPSTPRFSPDGIKMAFIKASKKGIANIWIKDLVNKNEEMVTENASHGITDYYWSSDGKYLLFIQDWRGDENYHLYSLKLNTRVQKDLTPFQGAKAQNIILSQRHPNQVLVGLNLRDPRVFDMHRIDLETGKVTLDTKNPGDVRWWLTDSEFKIRAAVSIDPEDSSMELRVREAVDKPWRRIVFWPFGESGVLEGYGSNLVIRFTQDGKALYIQSALKSDTGRLVKIDAVSGEELEIIAHDPRSNIWDRMDSALYLHAVVMFEPQGDRVQAVGFNYLKPEWKVLDSGIKDDFKFLQEKYPESVFMIEQRVDNDRKWLVGYFSDIKPKQYFLYDREKKSIEPLFDEKLSLEKYELAPMKPLVIPARDGLELPCYLTLPPGKKPDKLPMVLLVHGGPWYRDKWTFDSWTQWLANRGYAVLRVNYRGSLGFGKKFLNASMGQWGVGSMQHDLTDAVKWAIKKGIADPKRIAIMGDSYGGFAVLAGLAFTPDLYACGVDIVGLSNVKTFIESFPPYWEPLKRRWLRRIGDVVNDDDFNRKISPFFHVQNIRSPLIIAHGEQDPRVKIQESERIVAQMRERNLPVTFVVYPDEGHGLGRLENKLDFFGRAEEFLAKHLGGSCKPWKKVAGSSAQLR
ncbi:MAG: S9 family peptidase [Candidatus Aminicenantes bacterium]|nr:MAG: S9 family peptidase [Candidatus Aminicenantes bacterium]